MCMHRLFWIGDILTISQEKDKKDTSPTLILDFCTFTIQSQY